MNTIAILGASDLGATLARRLAAREVARRVVIVDADAGRARGKALDIRQSGPVEGFDTAVLGDSLLPEGFDALVLADPGELDGRDGPVPAVERARAAAGAFILVAGARPAGLLDAMAAAGLPRDRLIGSAPLATAAALRQRLAQDAGVTSAAITLTVFGAPPEVLLVPQDSATIGGLPADQVAPGALRRALAAASSPAPGPVALAAAAAEILALLSAGTSTVVPAFAVAAGEYGARGCALAGPVRLSGGRVRGFVEVTLAPVDRVALENTVEARQGAAFGRPARR